MKKTTGLLITLLIFVSFTQQKDTGKIYKDYSLMSVSRLFNSLFKEKDIVFLGEQHRIRQCEEFVIEIIPILQKQGVHLLFSEFANYSDTKLADSLLTARDYNEKLVLQIIHKSEWDWAYKEYTEIYKSAWTVNQNLVKGELPFRIIGLQADFNYSAIQTQQDWDNPEKRWAFWNEENNKTWLEIIELETINKNQKAVVHCGLHHSFTKFHHPIITNGTFTGFEKHREGTTVYNKYPQSVVTALIYSPLAEKPELIGNFIKPFNGVLDSLTQALPLHHNHFGFITSESKLGDRTDTSSYYSIGYGTLVMKDFCDAMIVVSSVCDYKPVTLIENFINEGNLENTIIQAFPYNYTRDWTVKSCNDSIRKWYENEVKFLKEIKNCNQTKNNKTQ
jgi:hypothetical protein